MSFRARNSKRVLRTTIYQPVICDLEELHITICVCFPLEKNFISNLFCTGRNGVLTELEGMTRIVIYK